MPLFKGDEEMNLFFDGKAEIDKKNPFTCLAGGRGGLFV